MYICNYCKRNFKEVYEVCPACGGTSFSTKSYVGDVIITEIPNEGWMINHSNLDKINKINWISILICIVVIIVFIPTIKNVYSIDPSPIMKIMRIVSIISIIPEISVIFYIIITNLRNKKYVRKIDELCHKGILIKGLPYEIIPAKKGIYINGKAKNYCIKINYKNSNGEYIPLVSDIKYDIDIRQKDTVDLLMDPNDFSNYYIDFEIF